MNFDPGTRQVWATGQTRSERRDIDGALDALRAVWTLDRAKRTPANTGDVKDKMKIGSNEQKGLNINKAVANDWIERQDDPGHRQRQLHTLTAKGRKVAKAKGWG